MFEITAGSINYIARQQKIAQTKAEYYSSLGIPPGAPTMKGLTSNPDYTGIAIPDDTSEVDNSVPAGWPQKVVFAPAGGPPGAPIQWGDDITNETVEAGFGYVGTGTVEEDLRYFYHSDHLGSTSYITDAKGNAVQYIAYMPFGETLAEQHADWDSPFKFNAKELDSETGLYYYGGRYYDPQTGRWISLDPRAEEMKRWSPYTYCFNNPLRFLDLDGLKPGDPFLTMDAAANDFGQTYNDNSIKENQEYGSTIYTFVRDGKSYYSYTYARTGGEAAVVCPDPALNNTVGDIHSHGKYLPQYDNDNFSPADKADNNRTGYVGYLTSPGGSLQKYDPKTQKVITVNTNQPSDKNDPARKNKIDPNKFPSGEKTYNSWDWIRDNLLLPIGNAAQAVKGKEQQNNNNENNNNQNNGGWSQAIQTISSWLQQNPNIQITVR